jgi:predicted RNA-binding Zn-ribbon protein involved in translation (DUF1610 family)
MAEIRDHIISPCVVCLKQISNEETPIYCPECSQPYHLKCWEEKGNKCIVTGCRGNTKPISTKLEKKILNSIKTNLKTSCPNCGRELLILYRYCPNCGFDVNSPNDQRTLSYFPLLKFFYNRRIEIGIGIGIISVALFLFTIIILINGSRSPSLSPTPQVNDYPTPTKFVYVPPLVDTPTSAIPQTTAPPIIPTQVPTEPERKTCPGAPPIRVEIGDTTYVTPNCGDHILMRLNPVVASNAEQYLYSGDELNIVDGPKCSNDVSFFLVEAPKYSKTGWVAESEPDNKIYCLGPGQ